MNPRLRRRRLTGVVVALVAAALTVAVAVTAVTGSSPTVHTMPDGTTMTAPMPQEP